ncbi:MAG: alpha/beta hydrolase, partial [Saprospiraceae bacterium]
MILRLLISVCLLLFYLNINAQVSTQDNVVGSLYTIPSKTLNAEKEIKVFLPASYVESETAYPVLYILDGQRYFLHGVSLQQTFIDFKQTPEFIIVGINRHPSERNRNYSVNAQQYLEFIENEVVAFIDKEFRTTSERMLFGWAFGGGFVIESLISNPELFDGYIAASPFPLSARIEKLDSFFISNPNLDRSLYFSSGAEGASVTEGTEKLDSLLQSSAPTSMTWHFQSLADEEHRSTPFTTLYHGIKSYFSHYPELQFNSLADFNQAGGLDFVNDYYQQRAVKYGFAKELSDWTMFSIT